MTGLSDHEPPPVQNQERPTWELVVDDMQERDRVGRARYGTPLQAHNGRRQIVDAYQEALDLVVYLRCEIAERDALGATHAALLESHESLQVLLLELRDVLAVAPGEGVVDAAERLVRERDRLLGIAVRP